MRIVSVFLCSFMILRSYATTPKEEYILYDTLIPLSAASSSQLRRLLKTTIFNARDPEVGMAPADMARHWGYPVESYEAVTDDGYILSVLRIPHGRYENNSSAKERPVVFLQHGLECSCTNWIANLPNQAAGFLMADAGFDVWLGNFRGNTYSKRHVTLTPDDHEFWQFSWDHMAQYDLPAMINLALNVTKVSQLYYVGHSMGTMTAFAKLAQDQEFSAKIKKFYALAPVTTVQYIKGVFRWIAPFSSSYELFQNWFGFNQFLPNNWIMDQLTTYFCGNPISDVVCTNILFLFAGPDSHQLNATRLPVYLSHTPAGTSSRNIFHFGQMVKSGNFQMYDYGSSIKNIHYYGQSKPPLYDVSKMTTPVTIFWSETDWLANPTDVQNLIPKLRNLADEIYLKDFNHLDFIWGSRAAPEIYLPIIHDIRTDYK